MRNETFETEVLTIILSYENRTLEDISVKQHIYIYIYHWLCGRVFANGPGDCSLISGRVTPKSQKVVLDTSLLNTQHYKVRIKGKVEQLGKGVALSPTPQCSSYWKGSFRVVLDYGHQLYFYYIDIHTNRQELSMLKLDLL